MFVATLTTIPSRINNECILAINSLLKQVDQIYLSVCTSYQRFPNIKIPDIFFQEPYFSKVTIVYNNDYGSATKYLGSLNQLTCKDQWVFVCDDDQEYKDGLIERLKPILINKNTQSLDLEAYFQPIGLYLEILLAQIRTTILSARKIGLFESYLELLYLY